MSVLARDAIAASGARVVRADLLPDRLSFSTDTRTLAPGDAYVALRGERFDGHAFAGEAVARGARALVVADAGVVPEGVAALVVADTKRAYLNFAGVARAGSPARVVAITGSTGKTTTKDLLAQMLGRLQDGRVAATPANENNEIGVAKLLLGLPDDTAFVVVEFGARHFGDIEPLARAARPHVAVLTNVGEAHLEIMKSAQRLADTKWAIFSTGAHPVLFAADAVSLERAASLRRAITWFSTDPDGMRVPNFGDAATLVWLGPQAPEFDGQSLLLVTTAEREFDPEPSFAIPIPCDVRVPGEHNRRNVAAAMAAAIALGFDAGAVGATARDLVLPDGRYERIEFGEIAAIYDAYNASMSGTLATLASFAEEPAARRIAVLGSMAELGDDAAAMHERVGAAAASARLDALLVGGDYAASLAAGAGGAGFDPARIVPFAANEDAVAWLGDNARAGDLVLLKASRRYRLEEIIAGLGARFGRTGPSHD